MYSILEFITEGIDFGNTCTRGVVAIIMTREGVELSISALALEFKTRASFRRFWRRSSKFIRTSG